MQLSNFAHTNFCHCGDAHGANYGKNTLNHHLQDCTQCVYHIYSVLKLLELQTQCCAQSVFWKKLQFSNLAHINFCCCGDAHHANYGKYTLNNHFQHCERFVYDISCVLKLLCCKQNVVRKVCFCENSSFLVLGILTFAYCGDAHGANYDKHTWNHHFQHCAHSLYDITVFSNFSSCKHNVLRKVCFGQNCSFLSLRILIFAYCGDAHHAKYA